MVPSYERISTERTIGSSHEGPIEGSEVVPFLLDTIVEGGRILVERGGFVYELVAGSDGELHVVTLGPASGA